MDTMKEYVKECEKAEEIQKSWKPQIGDFVYLSPYKEVFVITGSKEDGYFDLTTPHFIRSKDFCKSVDEDYFFWLPTQKQLQNMIRTKPYLLIDEFKKWFDYFFERLYFRPTPEEWSMERFWLHFVMYRKYNKIFSEGEWIKIKEKNIFKKGGGERNGSIDS